MKNRREDSCGMFGDLFPELNKLTPANFNGFITPTLTRKKTCHERLRERDKLRLLSKQRDCSSCQNAEGILDYLMKWRHHDTEGADNREEESLC